MALMSDRDFGDLSLNEMRDEFRRAADNISRNAYNRTRDTDPVLFEALWGGKVTTKGLEKELLDMSQENERVRYMNAYRHLGEKYGTAFTIESKNETIKFAKDLFKIDDEVKAVQKLRERERYLKDPKIRTLLKSGDEKETDEDVSISDLILQYVSNDYKLAEATGKTSHDLAILESSFSSHEAFKNFLMDRILMQESSIKLLEEQAHIRPDENVSSYFENDDKYREFLLDQIAIDKGLMGTTARKFYVPEEDRNNPNAMRYLNATTDEEAEAAWMDYIGDESTWLHKKMGKPYEETEEDFIRSWYSDPSKAPRIKRRRR